MAVCLINKSGGGVSSDDVTASKAQVLQGYKTVTTDSDDEVVEGTIPNRGHRGANTDNFSEVNSFGGYVVGFAEGYYKNEDGRQPYVVVPTSTVKQAVNYHPEKTLSDTITCGEKGQIEIFGAWNAATAVVNATWENPKKLYFRFKKGYYLDDGQYPPSVSATYKDIASAVGIRANKILDDENILGTQGTISRWVCNTGDVITALGGEGFAWDDSYAGRGRGIAMKIPNGHFIQGANYVFLPAPYVISENIREGVNMFGVPGGLPDYRIGRPVFENATFNALYVGGVANKDFPEARIYRERTQSHNNYSKYIGGTTIDVRASSNYHLSAFSNYVGFILDRAILFTFFRQLKVTYKLNMNMHTGRYNRAAGVNIFVFIYDANNRSRNIGGNQATHRSGDNIESVHNENTYELIVDTSTINQDGFVALCADAYSDDNLSSAIGNVTFTKIELIN